MGHFDPSNKNEKISHPLLLQFPFDNIFLTKLFCPAVRKNCSSDREQLLKFQAKGQEFAIVLRLLEQFIQTVNVRNNFW